MNPSPTNLIISPAYAWFPGNVTHEAIYGQEQEAPKHYPSRPPHKISAQDFFIGGIIVVVIVVFVMANSTKA